MVRIYEYQGKQILHSMGVPIPEGEVATTADEAREIATKIGKPVAVKSQIWATGRFKAGGIKFAENPEEAEKVAKQLLGAHIKGFKVEKILVEERLPVADEFYSSIIVDDSYKVKGPVLILSTEGGVDIEEVAKKTPEKVFRKNVDFLKGLNQAEVVDLIKKMHIPPTLHNSLSKIIMGQYEAFRKYDARVAEINPLVLTKDMKLYAADCRITIDDASAFRHPDLHIDIPRDMDRPATDLERIAWKIEEGDYRGICYFAQLVTEIKESGYVGFHGIGGGGAMLGADALVRHGLKLPNYADTSGNPTGSKIYRVVKIILSQPGIEGYALMGAVFASQEQWIHALAIVRALREELKDKPGFPVMILIAGNKEAEALQIFRERLKDLPIRLEIYGREYIYNVDYIAERMKTMVEEYRKERAKER